VLATIVGFSLIYSVLFVVEMVLMLAAIRKGPEADHAPRTRLAPPSLAPAE
jgi:cytochrome d ubiquinol oxidase subunit I